MPTAMVSPEIRKNFLESFLRTPTESCECGTLSLWSLDVLEWPLNPGAEKGLFL